MARVVLACVMLAACGASQPREQAPPPAAAPDAVATARPDEGARRAEIVAAHRKIEEEQQEALALTCQSKEPQPRCEPSCYAAEPPDVRAGKKHGAAIEIAHLACEQPGGGGPYALADELEGPKLALKAVRGRFPKAHKAGTWQEPIEAALAAELHGAKGDVVRVASAWRSVVHPVTKEKLRCVAVSHFTRAMRRPLDACGGTGAIACEASGNAAAHGLNVVHYRLAEARGLEAAGKTAECQRAALEAIAVARGMPRWRQYARLNVAKWVEHAAYRTRFDGTLDEDALFAAAASLGRDAEGVYAACGGGAPQTTAAQEQSFHGCW